MSNQKRVAAWMKRIINGEPCLADKLLGLDRSYATISAEMDRNACAHLGISQDQLLALRAQSQPPVVMKVSEVEDEKDQLLILKQLESASKQINRDQ